MNLYIYIYIYNSLSMHVFPYISDPNNTPMDPTANLALQQQNWNQWQAYQQQLAQWQAQYGEQV